MKEKASVIANCCELIKNVLLDGFNVPVIYFTPPYTDIQKIDMGIRATVWPNYNEDNTKISLSDSSCQPRILIIKSNLGFYNVLVFWGQEKKSDFLAIGPFRNDELSANYFTQILKEAHVTPATIRGIKHIYESMPFAQADTIVNVVKHILEIFIPEFQEVVPEHFQYAEQRRAVEINTDLLEQNFIKSSEQYRQLLFTFLKYLECGDNSRTKKALQEFLYETKFMKNRNMQAVKLFLHALNDYCHITLLHTDIHPSHVLKQSTSIALKIEEATSIARLEQLPNEIGHKYCILVKNYANPDYSRLTKDVIAYIELHFEEDLSLAQIASHFNKNSSFLSKVFSKETGQTVTDYIQKTRIQEAIRLFNATTMSVSEVALAVGYQDFSYFSKVFSKVTGSSPRKYKSERMTR